MQNITQEQILAMAPNAAAAANGKKISQKGGFVRLVCSGDDTFYLGECMGSGKSNYITTADFIDPSAPVLRCTCPSRQFPCKHGLALLYEIAQGKSFGICEIPEDIQKKREKKTAHGNSPAQTGVKSARPGAGRAARTKKLKKQLEGLALAEELVRGLLKAGLGTMGGTALDTYRQLAKQLGDYYLSGPQRLLNRLILEIAGFQKDGQESHYEEAAKILEKLWSLLKKSRGYLEEKLEQGDGEQDDNFLYEELGGVWKLSELEALGRGRRQVNLIQLAFWVRYDEARREYVDTGCWADDATGEICMTYNYRPLKALKYVKQEDSVFGTAQIPMAVYYPGEGNPRVRWDGAVIRPLEEGDLQKLRAFAALSLQAETKAAKNYLKGALADPMLIRLIAFERICSAAQGPALSMENGETILLGDCPQLEPTVRFLELLPQKELLHRQILLGAFYYDAQAKRLQLQPISIITDTNVVRLLY